MKSARRVKSRGLPGTTVSEGVGRLDLNPMFHPLCLTCMPYRESLTCEGKAHSYPTKLVSTDKEAGAKAGLNLKYLAFTFLLLQVPAFLPTQTMMKRVGKGHQ